MEKVALPISKYYPSICVEGLKETTKRFLYIACLGIEFSNPGPPKCEAGMLATTY
jgi:hypothetical protein